jgi:transketolase
MGARSIFVFTHDSIFLGEDGPTHQPIEHIACLRMIPDLAVWRPGDGLETGMAWAWTAGFAQGPAALLLSRQALPLIDYPAGFDKRQIWKGGYVLREDASAELTLIATGSELGTAQEVVGLLAKGGVKARLVSMPSVCVFKQQDPAYQAQVLGPKPRVTFEAGCTDTWPALVGSDSLNIGVDGFGMSAPADELAKHYGLTAPQVAERVLGWISAKAKTKA